jgi:hypothetical protein
MSQVEIRKRRVWQRRTYIWVLSGLITISALIYFEQTAVLFVLSTLAMCVLLTVVAFADLEGRDKALHQQSESSPRKDATVPVAADSSTGKRQKGAA